MAQGRSAARNLDVKKHQKRKQNQSVVRYRQGVEFHLRYCLELLQQQEKQLLREERCRESLQQRRREELYTTRRMSLQPDNPVTPDLRPLLALDPLAQMAPMSPLKLDSLDSDVESEEGADNGMQVCKDEQVQNRTAGAAFTVQTDAPVGGERVEQVDPR